MPKQELKQIFNWIQVAGGFRKHNIRRLERRGLRAQGERQAGKLGYPMKVGQKGSGKGDQIRGIWDIRIHSIKQESVVRSE